MARSGHTTVGSQFGLYALAMRCPSTPGAKGVSSIAARTVARLLTMRALGNEPTVPIGLPSTCVTSTIQSRSRGFRSRCLMARQRGRCLVNTSSQIYFVHLQLRAGRPSATRSDREEVAVPHNIGMQCQRQTCRRPAEASRRVRAIAAESPYFSSCGCSNFSSHASFT